MDLTRTKLDKVVMGTGYAEKEREFVDGLAADTGRDLDQWMKAISAAGHAKRNDIIDWLRQQGFAFPKASWLERIHHNGGRLIYADDAAGPSNARRAGALSRSAAAVPSENAAPASGCILAETAIDPPLGHVERADLKHGLLGGSSSAEVGQFLAAAKGLKPLAEFVLREIENAVPGISYAVATPYLTIAAPAAFAALHPAPKELRLFADFGAGTGNRVRKADVTAARGTPPFPEVLVLYDARQIDEAFLDLVASAYTRVLK